VGDAGRSDDAPVGRAEAYRWAREAMRRNAEALAREEALRNPPPAAEATAQAPPAQPPPPRPPPQSTPPPGVSPPDELSNAELQRAFEAQWRELDQARRDLLAEWSRLSRARERIEALYEHLDEMRRQLDIERGQLVVQREQAWIDRYQPASLPDRPWRDAAAHMLEAAVIVRAALAERAPALLSRLRDRAARGALMSRRRELPPGRSGRGSSS
jgi:hypothetical protein